MDFFATFAVKVQGVVSSKNAIKISWLDLFFVFVAYVQFWHIYCSSSIYPQEIIICIPPFAVNRYIDWPYLFFLPKTGAIMPPHSSGHVNGIDAMSFQ